MPRRKKDKRIRFSRFTAPITRSWTPSLDGELNVRNNINIPSDLTPIIKYVCIYSNQALPVSENRFVNPNVKFCSFFFF